MFNSILSSLKPNQPANGQQQPNADPESPWLISTAAKAVGTIAGGVSVICGFFLILDIFNVQCIFIGALLIVEGFFMILTEAPCCCVFFELAYMPSVFLDKRPGWVKATIYIFFAAIPFMTCPGMSTFFSCGLILSTSALYLLMALGKKANRDEMLGKSNGTSNGGSNHQTPITTAPTAVLVQNEEVPIPSSIGPGSNNKVLY